MSRLFVVGLGPGSEAGLTGQARLALESSDLICGYTVYVEQVRQFLPQKRYLATAMRSETERCRRALEAAAQQTVSMVCSGDPGIYGMAGLLLQLAGERPACEIEIIPGVTAAASGAALLGAPLMQDFAVISLSDLLVPWESIAQRLNGAALGDFVIVLYNPGSHGRAGHLRRACDILLQSRGEDTLCGLVRQISRPGEKSRLLTLGGLRDTEVDMFTTVFIGNSRTRLIDGKMVTPRGYEDKR